MTSFEMGCFFGNVIGCLASKGKFDISSLPPTRKIPSLSTNGDNLNHSGLLLKTLPPSPFKVVKYSPKIKINVFCNYVWTLHRKCSPFLKSSRCPTSE